MTISHRALDEDELAQASVAELYSALGEGDTPELFQRPYKLDIEHDIPNGGGTSIDGRTVYIDRRLWQEAQDNEFKATGLTPQQIIDRWCDHEHTENTIIIGDNAVDTYIPAHERALTLEHRHVLAILGRDDAKGKIRRYEETIWPALLRCYHRPIQKPPLDLWCGPNHDNPTERDREILAIMARLGVVDASKASKFSVHYGVAAHRCKACRYYEKPGERSTCAEVSGVVRHDRGCDRWHGAK